MKNESCKNCKHHKEENGKLYCYVDCKTEEDEPREVIEAETCCGYEKTP